MKQMILLVLLFSVGTMAQSLQRRVEMAKGINPQLQVLQIPNLASQKSIYIIRNGGIQDGIGTPQQKAVQDLLPGLKSNILRMEKSGSDISGGGWQHENRKLGIAGQMLIEMTKALDSDCSTELLIQEFSRASLDLQQDEAIAFESLPPSVQNCLIH